MSGIIGALLGALTGSQQSSAQDTHNALTDVLGLNQPGGLGALVSQFANGGMGNQMQSWVGSGSNLPITASEVQQVLSNDQVKALIDRTGLNVDELMPLVAKLLPNAVDQATPNGTVPAGGPNS